MTRDTIHFPALAAHFPEFTRVSGKRPAYRDKGKEEMITKIPIGAAKPALTMGKRLLPYPVGVLKIYHHYPESSVAGFPNRGVLYPRYYCPGGIKK